MSGAEFSAVFHTSITATLSVWRQRRTTNDGRRISGPNAEWRAL
jgi:hypothetical protein